MTDVTTIGTAVLEIIPSLRGVSDAIDKGTRDLKITPKIDTSGAKLSGQQAGNDINAGLQSANIGRGVSSSLAGNLLQGAESAGRNLGSLIATGLKSTAIAGGALAATGIAAALHAGFSRLTAIDDARFKLQGLGNDTVKVQSIMDNALAAVKGTAFGLDEAATTAASAVAAGIAPGKQLTDYLKLTADTAAIAGTSLADMGAIFNQVQTSGKAFTGDLDQLSDRGLPVFQWLQDEYKVSGAALSKMVSDGKVDAATFQKVIAEHISGAAQTMGGSIRGQFANLKASFSRFGAELSGPIFAAVSPLTIAFTGAFDKVTTAIKPFTAKLTAIIGPWATDLGNKITAWLDNGGVQKIVDWFGRLGDTFSKLTSGGGAAELKSIGDAVKGMGPALQQVGPALSAFGQAIAAVGPQTLTDFLNPALKAFGDTLQFVADHASWAVPLIGGLVLAFGGFKVVGDTVAPIFSALNGAFKIINTPIMLAQTAAIRAQAAAMTELSTALSVNTLTAGENAAASLGGAATKAEALTSDLGKVGPAAATAAGAGGIGAINTALSLIVVPAIGKELSDSVQSFIDSNQLGNYLDHFATPDQWGKAARQWADSTFPNYGTPGTPGAPAVIAAPPPPGQAPLVVAPPSGPAPGVDPNLFPFLLPKKAVGGPISGPGTGISDSILARVSNGEFIVNADATRKNMPLLEIINSGKMPGYAVGGVVGPDVNAAEQLVGHAYSQGSRYDCSGTVARIINAALGVGGDLMTTKSAQSWLSSRGFVSGLGGPGDISVGWYDHGPNPNDGHMAMTLSDGRNAESGGSHGDFLIGGKAAGASNPEFDHHMFLALAKRGRPAVTGQGDATTPDDSAAPLAAGAGGGAGLSSSFSLSSGFGLDSLGKGVGTTGSGSDLSLFGGAAASAVSGQASSLLGAFGIDANPPILQAASQLLGGIKIGGQGSGGSSAAPLSARSTATGTPPPDDAGNVHGTRAGQAPGPQVVYNIRTATVEDAFTAAQRKTNERALAKLSAY